jgi:hypothetical protein
LRTGEFWTSGAWLSDSAKVEKHYEAVTEAPTVPLPFFPLLLSKMPFQNLLLLEGDKQVSNFDPVIVKHAYQRTASRQSINQKKTASKNAATTNKKLQR